MVYSVSGRAEFDWTEVKKCTVVFVRCESCMSTSMHLSFLPMSELMTTDYNGRWKFRDSIDIDDALFYSVPTSFHAIDARIPTKLRELIAEAEGCLKSNFLTGASACARKVVYELSRLHDSEGDNYDDKIKSLKVKLPGVDPTYFDTLLTIQQVTSSKVHENSHDNWDSKHLRLILATLNEVLQEIYVVPAVRAENRKSILSLKSEVLGNQTPNADAV